MANETYLAVRGFAASEPTIYQSQEGKTTATLRLGVTASSWNRGREEYVEGETVWYSVRCYGNLAKNAQKCVEKGTPLLVRGRFIQRHWQDREGMERTELVIAADSIAVEISRGVVSYTKTQAESHPSTLGWIAGRSGLVNREEAEEKRSDEKENAAHEKETRAMDLVGAGN